jgi:hypothetical protein
MSAIPFAVWTRDMVIAQAGLKAFELDRLLRTRCFPMPTLDGGNEYWPADEVREWILKRNAGAPEASRVSSVTPNFSARADGGP